MKKANSIIKKIKNFLLGITDESLLSNWHQISQYLLRFLCSSDTGYVHIALWTLLQISDQSGMIIVFNRNFF